VKIEFINHASFILNNGNTQIMCDPWFYGTAFDNGWKLISKTEFPLERFRDITHIFFSHEHPDHFSPPTLKKIDHNYRKNIVILYQKTIDQKIKNYCKNLGFKKFIELRSNHFYKIDDKLIINCTQYTYGDSYILFKTPDLKILNINDCVFDSIEKVRILENQFGKIDILFTQFGYANKIGRRNEPQKRLKESEEKLNRIKLQYEYLRPDYIIPFASFIYFCHQENYYMNDGMNKINTVHEFIQTNLQSKPIIMYPNDVWEIGCEFNSINSINKYEVDYLKIEKKKLIQSKKVGLQTLFINSKLFVNRLWKKNPQYRMISRLKNASIFLIDYGESFILNGYNGLSRKTIEYSSCDIALSSEALNFVFLFEWGAETLNVNARFEIPMNGNYYNFQFLGNLSALNNRGDRWYLSMGNAYNYIKSGIIQDIKIFVDFL
tara:strand:- start:66 stop:1370 length:1305 start_codon:yes stop_codon:yes gene_type:complete